MLGSHWYAKCLQFHALFLFIAGEVPKSKVPGGVITIVPVVVVVLILTATCTTVTFLILG